MRHLIHIVVVVLVMAGITGCTTPYMTDRGRDAADIFTATVGVGAGAKARVGPVNVGIFGDYDFAGLRGGQFRAPLNHDGSPCDLTLSVLSLETFVPYCLDVSKARHKFFVSQGYAGLALAGTDQSHFRFRNGKVFPPSFPEPTWTREIIPYYTQVEVAIGLGGTIRLGFNPGELLDFILGWTTLDMFNDDVARLEEENEALRVRRELGQ